MEKILLVPFSVYLFLMEQSEYEQLFEHKQ